MSAATLTPADVAEHHRIVRFLFEEAEALDNRDYQAWLRLFADEFEYVAPLRYHRQPDGVNDVWAIERELGQDDQLPIALHNRASLEADVARIESGRSISDIPAWFTERVISNVLADKDADRKTFHVRSKFVVQRYKIGREQIIFGHREDRLIEAGGSLKIKSRRVIFSSDVYRWSTYVFI